MIMPINPVIYTNLSGDLENDITTMKKDNTFLDMEGTGWLECEYKKFICDPDKHCENICIVKSETCILPHLDKYIIDMGDYLVAFNLDSFKLDKIDKNGIYIHIGNSIKMAGILTLIYMGNFHITPTKN